MIKNTDEQLDKEIHRVRSWGVPSAQTSVFVELGCVISQHVDMFQISSSVSSKSGTGETLDMPQPGAKFFFICEPAKLEKLSAPKLQL